MTFFKAQFELGGNTLCMDTMGVRNTLYEHFSSALCVILAKAKVDGAP